WVCDQRTAKQLTILYGLLRQTPGQAHLLERIRDLLRAHGGTQALNAIDDCDIASRSYSDIDKLGKALDKLRALGLAVELNPDTFTIEIDADSFDPDRHAELLLIVAQETVDSVKASVLIFLSESTSGKTLDTVLRLLIAYYRPSTADED